MRLLGLGPALRRCLCEQRLHHRPMPAVRALVMHLRKTSRNQCSVAQRIFVEWWSDSTHRTSRCCDSIFEFFGMKCHFLKQLNFQTLHCCWTLQRDPLRARIWKQCLFSVLMENPSLRKGNAVPSGLKFYRWHGPGPQCDDCWGVGRGGGYKETNW